MATGKKEADKYSSWSGRVRVLSAHGIHRGTMFDPAAEGGNTHSEFVAMVMKYVRDHADTEATESVRRILSDWGDRSKLEHVRSKLRVEAPDEEEPFEVIVLTKTAQELFNDIGYTSFYISSPDGFTVVFNRDLEKADSLEHEYAHSQGMGINSWYQQLLFRGMNEALTENATSAPASYPAQRSFLNQIIEDNPKYEKVMYRAYVGSESARRMMFTMMVRDYGLEGFLTFARVAPIDNPRLSGNIGESIYIAPHQAIRKLQKNT